MSVRRRKLLNDAIAAIGAARIFVAGIGLTEYESGLMRRSANLREFKRVPALHLENWV
jgi:hypothetical protein